MYYQILVETIERVGKKSDTKRIYELDKTDKEEVLEQIIVPYLLKKQFQFDGYFLDHESVIRMVVKTTTKSVYELSKYENENMEQGVIMYVSPVSILTYERYTTDVTREIFAEAKSRIDDGEIKSTSTSSKVLTKVDKNKVFIVHGHDNLAKTEVARFIERLGFEPIILHEQASSGKTIIEKIEAYSNVGFGIVVYTPCDLGAPKGQNDLLPRARQNVVFEHGYLIGKIGRGNVCALVKENVETPNDISGVVYIPLDNHQAWHIAIAKELKNSGYKVDMNLVI